MLKPEFQSHDEALEFAAQLVEQMSINEMIGIGARRKRDREDAALRGRTIRETRVKMATLIRAFKDRPDLSPLTALREIAEGKSATYSSSLRDAWQLAARGWVRVLVTIDCTTNSIPPESRYEIEVTDKGRQVLAEADAAKTEQASTERGEANSIPATSRRELVAETSNHNARLAHERAGEER